MMPPSLCLEEDQKSDENVCKKNGDDLFKYNEVRVSHVWEEVRISSMSGEVCMDKGMCKSRTARSPGSANVQIEKEWVMLNALVVLKGSVSMCLYSKGHLMEH